MAGRRVSIRDVAREAGVSVTTVSHALNDKGRLNPETRERVREIAHRLGYRPNPAARSLVSGRTGLIAVLTSLPSGVNAEIGEFGFFSELVGGATGVAVAHDVALVVAPADPLEPTEAFVWDRVPLDGVIVAGPLAGDVSLPALRERGIPFVTIGRDPAGGDHDAVVAADDVAGTRAVLDHLHAAGARRPALITLPPIFAITRDVADTYATWCDERGCAPCVEVVHVEDLLRDRTGTVTGAVERAIAEASDAIYCPVEQLGVIALAALTARGRRVPEDVLLATTNDGGRAEVAPVPITTLDTDHRELGRRAVDLLLDVIVGDREPPVLELVGTSISPRRSTSR